MAFCASCGKSINDGSKFCKFCGAPVSGVVVEETVSASVEGASGSQNVSTANTQQPTTGNQVPPTANQNQAYSAPNQGQVVPNTAAVTVDLGSDHTSLFSKDDISKNKVFAIGTYLLGFLGIIVALLAARESKFAMFHAREAMKLIIAQMLLGMITLLLIWTIIVPLAALICYIILGIVQLICIFRACKGQAKKAPIVGSFKFLE